MKEPRSTFSLDFPFIGCGTMLLFVIIAPLMWMAAQKFATPTDDGAYRAGALAMCFNFAESAGVLRGAAEPVCAELADEIAAGR